MPSTSSYRSSPRAQHPSQRPASIQLDHWSNSKASLSTSQRTSVNRLADWLHRNSPEYKVSLAAHTAVDLPPSLPETTAAAAAAATVKPVDDGQTQGRVYTASSSAAIDATASSGTPSLPDASAPLSSAQDFLAWFTTLSHSITSATQTSHQLALSSLSSTTATARSLLSQLERCQIHVSELRAGAAFVQDSSKDLRDEAQTLLDSQLHLDRLSDDVLARLSFFTLLPYATALLSSPDASVVHSNEFLELLDQLELALVFLRQPPASGYRDAALYRMRYAQCVTRGATLAKMAVCRTFKDGGEEMAARLKAIEQREKRGVTVDAREEGKGKGKAIQGTGLFSSALVNDLATVLFDPSSASLLVTKLRPLIHELERRAFPHLGATSTQDDGQDSTPPTTGAEGYNNAPEFESLLDECKVAWSTARRPILSRLVGAIVVDIEASPSSRSSSSSPATAAAAGDGTIERDTRAAEAIDWFETRERHAYRGLFVALPAAQPSSTIQNENDRENESSDDTTFKTHISPFVETLQSRLVKKVGGGDEGGATHRGASIFSFPFRGFSST